jgi:F0F1-type ATP synthase alpha subunit
LFFGSDTVIKDGDLVKCTGSIVVVPAGKDMLGHVVDALGVPIDGRGALSDHEQRCVAKEAPLWYSARSPLIRSNLYIYIYIIMKFSPKVSELTTLLE